MKTVEIFDGRTLRKVSEGDKVLLYNQFLNPGTEIVLSARADTSVLAIAEDSTGQGTFLKIIEVRAHDELASMRLEAEDVDVEVETIDYSTNDVNEKIQIPRNLSKKNLVARLAEEGIDIDTKKTKAQIYAELEGLDNVELV